MTRPTSSLRYVLHRDRYWSARTAFRDPHGRYSPPLALSGHAFVLIDRGNREGGKLWDAWDPERPALYRCHRCWAIVRSWEIVERLYPMPCPGWTRAIGAAS